MKNILIFNWWDIVNPKAGGAEVYLDELFSRLAKKRYSITLICSSFPGGKKTEVVHGITVRRIAPWWIINLASILWYFRHRNNFDLIVDFTNKVPYLTPLYICKKPHFAFALHVFGNIWKAEWGFIGGLFSQVERMFYHFYRQTNMIAISKSTRNDLAQVGLRKEKIDVIYPGVSLISHKKIEKSKNPTVIYLGRLKKYKRTDLIIQSWPEILAKYPDAKLWIVGTGSDEARLKRKAKSKNIFFLGRVSEKEKYIYLQKSWLLVQPSVKEGWGLTVMEAAVVGTPSLVANSPGLKEIVSNHSTGWLFPANDQARFSRSIINILGNFNLRKKIAQNARISATKFSWDKSAKDLDKYIQKIM